MMLQRGRAVDRVESRVVDEAIANGAPDRDRGVAGDHGGKVVGGEGHPSSTLRAGSSQGSSSPVSCARAVLRQPSRIYGVAQTVLIVTIAKYSVSTTVHGSSRARM